MFTSMLKNYLKSAFRNLKKHPAYSLIHILGLALGLTAFLFIYHYTSFEKSYDLFHDQPEQLYRLTTDQVIDGKLGVRDAMSFAPSGKALMEDLPEVQSYTTTYKTSRMIFKKDDQPLEEKEIIAVDSNFLNLFHYEVLQGDPATMLNEPYSLVLTEALAQKYFGDENPIGKSIEILGRFERAFKVTGLLKNTPANTHYSFNGLVSLKSFHEQVQRDAWSGYNYYTYLLLDKQADLSKIHGQLPALTQKYLGEETQLVFNLQPVKDIHLYSDFTFEPEIHGSAKAVYFLDIISIFILLIAWVNYINLSTARAMERAKEVGLKKVIGAQRSQLLIQFMSESLLINFLGAVLALFLADLMIPYFNELVGKTVLSSVWGEPSFLLFLGLFFIVGTVVNGLYPAIVLSSFRPVEVLKGVFGRSKKGALMRKTLVVAQFAASLGLIASTVIVYQQIRYMSQRDMGIDIEKVVGVQNPVIRGDNTDDYLSTYKSFTTELRKVKGVEKVAGLSNLPGGGSSDISSQSGGVKVVGMTDRVNATIYINTMDQWLPDALSMMVISGRTFDYERASDTSAVMVNQAFLSLLNLPNPDEVVNEYIQFGRNPDNSKFLIVGVVNDFNRTTLKNNMEPTVFFHERFPSSTVMKLSGESIAASINGIQEVWSSFFPDAPFTYDFLDQRFEKLYQEDRKFGFIFFNFALLAIFVASIGLFGLSSYMALQRTKEFGIRKVLGAPVSHIVLLFFRDFLWLILIAVLVGLPLVYLGMTDWLNGYAYRIDFPWWVISLTVFAVVLVAFFTVSYQSWKLARLNPVKTLRYE